jgi:ABC-2 type transport system permease protein
MNLRRTAAVARKEFLHVLRDPLSLAMALAIPLLMLLLFGYALTLDVDRVPLAIYDQSQTPQSRDLISRFLGSRYFASAGYVDDYAQVESAIDRGHALAALVVPEEFARQVQAGRPCQVQFILDGSDANTATIAQGYAEAVAAEYGQSLLLRQFQRRGLGRPDPPLDLRQRVLFNTELESRNFIIPGLIAVIMTIIAALLTSLTVAREWERGTMEQLISTPIKPVELIVGKLAPYFVIAMADVTLAVVMGQYLFAVPLRGSVALLFAMAAIFLAGALSLGMVISTVTRNQLLASQMAILVTFVPSYLLSGFMFSIQNMPRVIQAVTYLIPARYFIQILKGIYLKGVGLEILGVQALLMTLFASAAVVVAKVKFRKKLA